MVSMKPSLCIGSLQLGQDFKWQEKTTIQDLCLFHGDPHNPQIPQHRVSFSLKGIVDTKAVSLYMYDHWRWEAYSLDEDIHQFLTSVFGNEFYNSQHTKKALILQMNKQEDPKATNLLLYGQKQDQELTLYAHRLRQYHEFVSLSASVPVYDSMPASQSSVVEEGLVLEQEMIEGLLKTKNVMDVPLPKPSSSQRPTRSHSQQTVPQPSVSRSQKNTYQANKNLLKQCVKHELTRQGNQDADIFQVVYHDMTYHYKEKLHTTLMTEQQLQIPSKMFIDFHLNFKAMLSMV